MPVRIAAAVVATSLLLAPAALADTSTPATLSVQASGSVMVTPDLASVSVSVNRSAPTSRVALSAANRVVDKVVAGARGAGVPSADIQTTSISVSRGTIRVGPRHHQHRVTRYTASESVSITSSSAAVGRVVDAATVAGASSIDGPTFSFSNPDDGQVAANDAALANARAQANAAAAALGYTVTGVQSVDLNPQSSVVPGSAGSGASPTVAAAPSVPTTLHPGAVEVDATVAVVFTIAPA